MDLLKECMGAEKIGISAHIRPDGDAVGSSMALYLYLKKEFPNSFVKLMLETPPESMGHLKYIEEIDCDYKEDMEFDLFFALDTVSSRLGEAEPYFNHAKKRINIDHHISNADGCGDINLVLSDASSTAEVLCSLIPFDKMNEDIAVALYTGMIHDCGVFQYSNTSPKTMEIAAKLISFGFDFSKIIEESFYQKTVKQNRVMGRVLLDCTTHLNGRCIKGFIDQNTLKKYDAEPADLEGIVSQLRNSKGVDCAIFIYETNESDYKVSLRSNEKVNVSEIASSLGGGGHVRAAGVTMKGSIDDITSILLDKINEQLKYAF